jgi:Ni/Co efflux regulator RcnB
MNKVIATALLSTALLASASAPALAQERTGRAGQQFRDHPAGSPERAERRAEGQEVRRDAPDEGRRAGRAGIIRRDAPQPPPAPQAQPAPAAPQAPSADAWRHGGDRRDSDRRDWDRRDSDRRDRDRGDRDRSDQDRRDWDRRDDGRRDDGWRRDDHRWNQGHRPSDRDRPRYDRRYYPPVFQAPNRHRIAPYRPPAGWYAHTWRFGDSLPYGWYGPQYRLMDWWAYGLPMPPIGYEWVRIGDDAVLVDIFSGRVVQVAYRLFW